MFKILTLNSFWNPTKELSSFISETTNLSIIPTIRVNSINSEDTIIRYGNHLNCSGVESGYNSVDFITLCRSKLLFSNLMKERGIYSPIYHREEQPTKYPILIRTTLTGCGGNGIIVCNNEEEFINNNGLNYYWTEFVQCSSEYRCHILGGNLVKLFKKVRTEGDENSIPIRNLSNGYHFSLRNFEHGFDNLLELINTLKEVMNGKFYSLDVGWNREQSKYFIFEANSASGLNGETVKLYADYLIKELEIG